MFLLGLTAAAITIFFLPTFPKHSLEDTKC